MRPPEHWHVRRGPPRRNRRATVRHDPWRRHEQRSRKQLFASLPRPSTRSRSRNAWLPALGVLALVVLATLLVVRFRPSGSEATAADPPVSQVLGEACDSGDTCSPANGPGIRVQASTQPPQITARAAAVFESPCNELLYGRNLHQRLAPASLTKMMTALVAVDRSPLSRMTVVDVNGALLAASTNSSVMGLEPGMELSMGDLLYGLLLPSGNDAALAIAHAIAGNEAAFVQLMNSKASALGLVDTHFENPHGLDQPNHYTSAYDIGLIGAAVLDKPQLAAIVRTTMHQPAWDGPAVWNGNELLATYPGLIGVKIGYTEKAGQTMVAAAERGGRRVIVSVLASWDRYSDVTRLLDWAFDGTASACPSAARRP